MSAAAGGGALAVLDVLIAADEMTCGKPNPDARQARAAVAELVESDRQYDNARKLVRKAESIYGKRSAAAKSARVALSLASERRAAALSNIEGGQ